MVPSILIIDDEATIRRSLRHIFQAKGYRVLEAGNGAAGLSLAQAEEPEVILLDLKLPDCDGIELFDKLKAAVPEAAVIVLTGHGSVEAAVAAIRKGAEDFLEKDPRSLEATEVRVEKAVELLRLRRENLYLKGRVRSEAIIPGEHQAIRRLNAMVDLLAQSPSTTVLIQGESGTGKELLARAIHLKSLRKDKPFLEINCAGLSETLLESELFGHEKGAFTDAKALKRGLLEVADGGTVLLDEVGDLPSSVQPKLLRVLESKAFRRVGGTRDIAVDVRIIAATNKDLAKLVEKGGFREDLYYRLKVMPLQVPPLRERGGDILLLADLFVKELNALLKKRIKGYTKEAQSLLLAYPWPGNVRELRNVTERAMILCQGDWILPAHLPAELQGLTPSEEALTLREGPLTLEELEKKHIQEVLASAGGNRSQAAKVLGISRSTLQEKIRKYRL